MTIPSSSRAFDQGAAAYEATVARTLLPVAKRVVALAALQPGERVLDVGTGTGIAAAAALGDGRRVVGIDGAPAMIERAHRNVRGASFAVMDFAELNFRDGTFDAVTASHSLLFATNRVAVLTEWRRVTRRGGRLSLSTPGPAERSPTAVYQDIYEGRGIATGDHHPTASRLIDDATAAGWLEPAVVEDPWLSIRLADETLFRAWRSIGSRAEATREWSPDEHEAMTREMLAVTPRDRDGTFVIPFGAIYLTARNGA